MSFKLFSGKFDEFEEAIDEGDELEEPAHPVLIDFMILAGTSHLSLYFLFENIVE